MRFFTHLITLCAFVLSCQGLQAQTTLIDPSADGGFENGLTFAANNWTAVNAPSPIVDNWYIERLATIVNAGSNGAFISSTGNTTWSYSQASNISHIYYDVTIPAGESKLTLSFNWKVGGEGGTTSDWDNMKVFFGPVASLTPTTNTGVSAGFQKSGPGANNGMYKLTSSSWQSETIVFSGVPGQTYRLVFSWKSDGSTIANPPAAIDNVSLVSSSSGTFVSAASGDWNTPATWVGGAVPSPGDNATISAGHTVALNSAVSITNLDITGTVNYGNTTTSNLFVDGNLTLTSTGKLLAFNGITGRPASVRGNINNGGEIDMSKASAILTLDGPTVQTVSGEGTFTLNIIKSLTVTNTSTSIPNVIWGYNNIKVHTALNLTSGRVALGVSGTNSMYLGTPTGDGTVAAGTLTAPSGYGFINGKFGRVWTTTGLGSTITAGADPTATTSKYPFVSSDGRDRSFWIQRTGSTTGNVSGQLKVTFVDAAGNTTLSSPIADGAYSITDSHNSSWSVVSEGGYTHAGTHNLAILGQLAYPVINSNSRIHQATGVLGLHQAGSTTVGAQRTGLTTAQLISGAFYIGANASDIATQSVQSGPFDDPNTWLGGIMPSCSKGASISSGHTVTASVTGLQASSVVVQAGGTLKVDAGGSLTLGCTNNNSSLVVNGTLDVTGGSLNVNGNLNANAGSTVKQSGGLIKVDGNSGTAATSVATGTNLVRIVASAVANLSLTGGTLQIVDPHAGISTTDYALNISQGGAYNSASTSHTVIFGDGVSTTAGGNTNGMYCYLFAGAQYFGLGNVEVNTLTGTNRFVRFTSNHSFAGNFTINSGEFTTSAGNLFLAGNLTVNSPGVFTNITNAINFAAFNGSTTVNPNAQTVDGNGTFRNLTASPTANFSSITVNNSSATGVSFLNANSLLSGSSTGTVSGTLTFTNGRITTPGSTPFILGISVTSLGTLSVTQGGFAAGSNLTRWWGTGANTGATITAGSLTAIGVGSFPFVTAASTNNRRDFHLRQTTIATTGGKVNVSYADAAGNSTVSITDGTYLVDSRSNGGWTVSQTGITGTPTYSASASGQNIYFASSAESRLVLASAVAPGAHQGGTAYPNAQRTGIGLGGLTQTFHIGINSADIAVQSVATGNWDTPSTWSTGAVPGCNDLVVIQAGNTVTVNTSGRVCKNLTINPGGEIISQTGADLTVGCTNNNASFIIAGGTYDHQGGTLNVNGRIQVLENTTNVFKQSAGIIKVDGNSGTVATSAPNHIVDMFCTTTSMLQFTGGEFMVVDPAIGSSGHAFKVYPSVAAAAAPGWKLTLGDGVSTQVGGTAAFTIETYRSAAPINAFKLGEVNVNTMSTATDNRFVQTATSGNLPMNDLVIQTGEYRALGVTHYISGNVINNGILTNSSGTLTFSDFSGNSIAAGSAPQTISGTGIFRNNATPASVTGNLLSLTLNNPSGLTLNVPISVSSTLTLTNGKINTTATNLLTLGTTVSNGSFSGAPNNDTHINGPMARYTPASTTPTAGAVLPITKLLPVGVSGVYLPIWIQPTTTVGGSVLFTGQVFSGNSTSSTGANVTSGSLSDIRWEAIPNSTANLTDVYVQVGQTGLVSGKQILQAPTATGPYDTTPSGIAFDASTPPTIRTLSGIPTAAYTGYFSHGEVPVCAAPSDQPTSWVTSLGTTSGFVGSWTPPTTAPSNYLVVRYAVGATEVAPTNNINYAIGNGVGAGTGVVRYTGTNPTFTETGLTASTAYTYYVYSFNNAGCLGPVYNVTSALTGGFTACATAPALPTLAHFSTATTNSVDLSWTASSTAGATYFSEIATNSTFSPVLNSVATTSSPASFTGLNSGTQYWMRTRAVDAGCYSTSTTTAVVPVTECTPTTVPYIENFNTNPVCHTVLNNNSDGNFWTILSAPTSPAGMTGNAARMIYNTAIAGDDYLFMRPVQLTAGISYDVSYKLATTSASWTEKVDVRIGTSPTAAAMTTILADYPALTGVTLVNGVNTFVPTASGVYYIAFKYYSAINQNVAWLDDFSVVETPACSVASPGTITSSLVGTVCGTTTGTVSATGFTTTGLGLSFQWESSTDNSMWSSIAGATNPASAPLNSFTIGQNYFRLKATCSNGPIVNTSNVINLNYGNPTLASTTPATRCGLGSVNLQATPTMGSDQVRWYSASTGGTYLATGNTYATPAISASTDYFAAPISPIPGTNVSQGAGATTSATYSNPFYSAWSNNHTQHLITVAELAASGLFAGQINSVALNITNAGTLPMIDLSVKMGHTTATNASAFADNSGFTSVYYNASLLPTLGVNVLTFSTPFTWDGTSNIILEFCHGNGSSTATMSRTCLADNTSYVSSIKAQISAATSAGTICSDISSQVVTYSARPVFIFNGVGACEGARSTVTATVTTPPSITPAISNTSLCLGESTTLSATSTNAGYTYSWSAPVSATGASLSYTPTALGSATYTVTATDNSTGANAGCVTTGTVGVTVNPVPSAVTVTPASTTVTCGDPAVLLTASGGTIGGTFTIAPSTTTIGSNTGNPYRITLSNSKLQFLYTAAELTAAGVLPGSVNSISFEITSGSGTLPSYKIDMGHLAATAFPSSTHLTGLTNVFIASAPITLAVGVNTHVLQTPFVWNGTESLVVEVCFEGITTGSTPTVKGTTGAGNVTLHSTTSCSTVTGTLGTTRPFIILNTSVPTAVTWAPFTGLYTDAAATTAYTGGTSTTVYAKPAATSTYTATATTTSGCTSSSAANITVNCSSILTLTNTFIEGYMDGTSGNMRPVMANAVAQGGTVPGVPAPTTAQCDLITVELHATTSPCAMVHTATAILSTTGAATVTFPSTASGNSFYVVVKGRNIVETWSAAPVAFTATASQSFATAFGGNLGTVSSVPVIYSGDFATAQDGFVDAIDYAIWDADYNNFSQGYIASDLNGDGLVDALDFTIWETNYNNFVGAVKP
jgi:hypothetical protein